MNVFKKISETTHYLKNQKKAGKSIGFVPTMGALHDGHLELMRRAKAENDILAVSIFVNPIQFSKPEDLEKYPRDVEKDKKLLESVGCDILFVPDVNEMYPGVVNKTYDFGLLEKVMEGAFRSGHFNGVAIVVKKLFEIILPTRAYFGEKDFQQLAIIQKLVEIENIPVEIIPCPIVRESDGLAMSSRNERLTNEERKLAPFMYNTLTSVKQKVPSMNIADVQLMVKNMFKDQPGFTLEYFEIAEDTNLQPVSNWLETKGIVAFIAAYLGNVRLIDNIRII
jgi:pantoate--beta-alanine ligase